MLLVYRGWTMEALGGRMRPVVEVRWGGAPDVYWEEASYEAARRLVDELVDAGRRG